MSTTKTTTRLQKTKYRLLRFYKCEVNQFNKILGTK